MFSHTTTSPFLALLLALAVPLTSAGCGLPMRTPSLHEPSSPPVQSKGPLKVHLKSGELMLLDSWTIAPDQSRVDGQGTLYSVRREAQETGVRSIPMSEVALLETNASSSAYTGGAAVLGLLTVVVGTVSGICVVDPKACFGSCPTFYLGEDADSMPFAEGFSSSIARALEARDVDAIFSGPTNDEKRLVVTMRNEALETHAVRRVRLLAAPRPEGERILAGPSETYFHAFDLQPPLSCAAAEGDCSAAMTAWDGVERSSPADDEDLATREEIDLVFPAKGGELGLVLGARQSLMSTYLFYQTMAHFGSHAGEFLAAVERGGPAREQALAMARVLGGIEAFVAEGDDEWRPVGTYEESGPIAGDVRVLPFHSRGSGPIRVRLRLTKGHWRLGYVALARLGDAARPEVIEPASVHRHGQRDIAAEATWREGSSHVVTQPGDSLRLVFNLPQPARQLELFLESEGFYYEWMRAEWLAEEDPAMALVSVTNPHEALRRLAGPFKEHESTLDAAFWSSRFRSVR